MKRASFYNQIKSLSRPVFIIVIDEFEYFNTKEKKNFILRSRLLTDPKRKHQREFKLCFSQIRTKQDSK